MLSLVVALHLIDGQQWSTGSALQVGLVSPDAAAASATALQLLQCIVHVGSLSRR